MNMTANALSDLCRNVVIGVSVWVRPALDASEPGVFTRSRVAQMAGGLYASNDVDAPSNSLREGKNSVRTVPALQL